MEGRHISTSTPPNFEHYPPLLSSSLSLRNPDFTMGFTLRSALIPLLSHVLRHKQSSPTKSLQDRPYLFRSLPTVRTRALTTTATATASSLVLAVSSPPAASGDVSVLLQTSAVLLMAYWIANFVVPDIISKSLESDEPSREQTPDDKIPSQDESGDTLDSNEASSRRKRRRFKETKTSKF